jgi:hypothetical protein
MKHASQVARLKTGVLRNSGNHPRTYLLTIMESKDEVGISIMSKGLARSRLSLYPLPN